MAAATRKTLSDEAAETEVETYEEPRGLRERFSSLIGRDLGDHPETPGDRREPPLQSAPMPHVDPDDRAIFDAAVPARHDRALHRPRQHQHKTR